MAAGIGGVALAVAARGAFAAGADKALKVGFVSPRTGALGGFGETDGYVLEVARKALSSGFRPIRLRSSIAIPSPIRHARANWQKP
jgi:branched-chain amino acid transport system substrate-binding protein